LDNLAWFILFFIVIFSLQILFPITKSKSKRNKRYKYNTYRNSPAKAIKAFETNSTKSDSMSKKEIGDHYEVSVGKKLENEGYIVKYHGLEKGLLDRSIDLIAIRGQEAIFIQCKNWSEKGSRRISQVQVKSFLHDVDQYIAENAAYSDYSISKKFIISGKILSKAAYAYIMNNRGLVSFEVVRW
jgi:hypothetical protein